MRSGSSDGGDRPCKIERTHTFKLYDGKQANPSVVPKISTSDVVSKGMNAMRNITKMNGRAENGFVSSAVRRFFGGHSAGGDGRHDFDEVGAFLEEHELSAKPQNYDIAYRYLVDRDEQLVDTIDDLLASGRGLSDAALGTLYAQLQSAATAEKLSQIVSSAQTYISQTAKIIDDSRSSVKSFGDDLELVELPQDLAKQIVGLTKAMIVKSRRFEDKLKRMDNEIGDLKSRLDDARKDAMLDPLTNLPNRRAFHEKLNAAVSREQTGKRTVCIAYCDIDHFKLINDTYGHEVGDRVLQFLAKRIQETASASMSVARFGGEEFVVLFEDSTLGEAIDHMDFVRADFGERRLVCRDSGEPLGKISFSAGVAAMERGIDGEGLLKAADQALYRAKELGRDRVETLLSQHR